MDMNPEPGWRSRNGMHMFAVGQSAIILFIILYYMIYSSINVYMLLIFFIIYLLILIGFIRLTRIMWNGFSGEFYYDVSPRLLAEKIEEFFNNHSIEYQKNHDIFINICTFKTAIQFSYNGNYLIITLAKLHPFFRVMLSKKDVLIANQLDAFLSESFSSIKKGKNSIEKSWKR